MKTDNQHLDFLISQYVDGCLEGANKKSVEQKMLIDPAARGLYAEHRDVQDLLDDWGNRIPMIDWAQFDGNLAKRLEKESLEKERVSIFRRRLRPFAAAAALLLAVGLGYAWHAMSHAPALNPGNTPEVAVAGPVKGVQILDMTAQNNQPSQQIIIVEEGAAEGLTNARTAVATILPPEDSEAVQSLNDTLALGMQNLPSELAPQGSVSSGAFPMTAPQDEKELR